MDATKCLLLPVYQKLLGVALDGSRRFINPVNKVIYTCTYLVLNSNSKSTSKTSDEGPDPCLFDCS